MCSSRPGSITSSYILTDYDSFCINCNTKDAFCQAALKQPTGLDFSRNPCYPCLRSLLDCSLQSSERVLITKGTSSMSEQQEHVSPSVSSPSTSSVASGSPGSSGSGSPVAPAPSAPAQAHSTEMTVGVPEMMVGRWIWFGLQRFAEAEWDAICRQAAAWKVQGLHPKVADGIYRWYDDGGLAMLKQVAQRHGLGVVPYHYCSGPQVGAG